MKKPKPQKRNGPSRNSSGILVSWILALTLVLSPFASAFAMTAQEPAEPPFVEEPAEQPSMAKPLSDHPTVEELPTLADPPAQGSPETGPTVEEPPSDGPPVAMPPAAVDPLVATPPAVVDPPVATPPAVVDPLVATPPAVVDPLVATPPAVTSPPAITPPAITSPPAITPPAITSPPAVTPPAIAEPAADIKIVRVEVVNGGAEQFKNYPHKITKVGDKYYTNVEKASMTDARIFTLEMTTTPGALGIESASQFDPAKLRYTYGGKELEEWKKLSGDTDASAISVLDARTEAVTGGGIKLTIEVKFDVFFTQRNTGVNIPYAGYTPTTKTGFKLFADQLSSPLGIQAFIVNYEEKELGSKDIYLNLYDSYRSWQQVDEAAQRLKAESDGNGNTVNGKYVKVEDIGRSWSGNNIWNVVVAKDQGAVEDYLYTTKPMMLSDPGALKKELDALKSAAEKKHKAVIYFNNVHPDETPGIDGIVDLMESLVYGDPDGELSFKRQTDTEHVDRTDRSAGYTKQGETDPVEVKVKISDLLDNFIIVANYTENPDGRDDLRRTNDYYFDLNRDAAYQTQPEAVALTKNIVKWNPMTMIEFHGYVTGLLIEPCTGPHDPNYEYDLFADRMLSLGHALGEGILGSTSYNRYLNPAIDFADGWDDGAPVYGPMFAMLYGTMGYTLEIPHSTQDSNEAVKNAGYAMFNECLAKRGDYFGNLLDIKERGVENEDNKAVDQYLINPYLPETHPNYVVGRPRPEGRNFFPEYFIIPVDEENQRNRLEAYKMLNTLLRNGAELSMTNRPVSYGVAKYPAGTYVIDMHQANRAYVNSMLSSGYDGSEFKDIYAELVIAYPEMRNFDRETVYEKGIFRGLLTGVNDVLMPVTQIEGSSELVAVKNNSIDAVRLVNRLLKAGKTAEVLTNGVEGAGHGDYIVKRSDMDEAVKAQDRGMKGELLVYGVPVGKIGEKDKAPLKKPLINILGSETHSRYVLDLLEFDGMYDFVSGASQIDPNATVIVGFNNGTDVKEKIEGGTPYIAIGTNALSFVKSSGLLPGFDYKRPGASYNEGLVKASYAADDLVAANYDRTNAAYVMNGTFITGAPNGGKALITVSGDEDFFLSGWYPNHDALKGQMLAASGYAGAAKDVAVTLFANNIFSKGHAQHIYNMFANAVYLSTSGIQTGSGGAVQDTMDIVSVEVVNGGAEQFKNYPHKITKVGDKYYTNVEKASMTDARIFKLEAVASPAALGITDVSQFDETKLGFTYGGKALKDWKKLSGDTGASPISVVSVTAAAMTDGGIKVSAEVMFDVFFAQKDTGVNIPYAGYTPTTKTGFPIFADESASPLGAHALTISFEGKEVGSKSIDLNLYDSYRSWQQVDAAARKLKEESESGENTIKGKYVKMEAIGRSWSGNDIWNVVVAKDQQAVNDYLNTTKPMMIHDPMQLRSELYALKSGGEKKHKAVIYYNNVHPDETPGIDGIVDLMESLIYGEMGDELSFMKQADTSHVDRTDKSDGYTKQGTAAPAEMKIKIAELLDNFIIVANFTENPDGRDDLRRTNDYYFDLNRDAAYQTQPEAVALTQSIVKWNPMTMIEFHGYVTGLLIEPCTGPHDPNYEYDLFADRMLSLGHALGEGILGSTSYNRYLNPAIDFADGWDDGAPVYGPMFAMLYGTMGYTLEIPHSTQDSNEAVKNAGYAMFKECLINRADYYNNLLDIKLRGVKNEDNKEVDKYLINPYLPETDPNYVVGRPRQEGKSFFPEYYVIPVDEAGQRNRLEAYKMLNTLLRNGAELSKTHSPVSHGGTTYPAGTYVLDMRQANRAYVNSMLSAGYDGSEFKDIYAELVIAYPEMRNFDRKTIYEKDVFQNALAPVTSVEMPKTAISGSSELVAVENNSIDAVRLVNRLLKAGKPVEMLRKDTQNAKHGDYIVKRSDLMEAVRAEDGRMKGELLVYGIAVSGIASGDKGTVKKPLINIIGSQTHSRYVLDLLEFDGMYAFADAASIDPNATVIVGFNNGTDVKEKIEGGTPYIGIGTNALSFVKTSGLLPGFDYDRPGASYNEGLVKASYAADDLAASGYGRTDAAYVMNGTFITGAPTGGKALITVSGGDDFFLSGWYPDHDVLKGKMLAALGTAGTEKKTPMTLFANNIFSKGHAQHTYNMFANAVYLSASGIPSEVLTGGGGGGGGGGGSGSATPAPPVVTEPGQTDKPAQFNDVDPKDWFADAVNYVVEKNYFSGTGGGNFAPYEDMTRGMFVTVLGKLAGFTGTVESFGFADVKDTDWYGPGANWAARNNIVAGIGGNKFGPDQPITREQICVMIVNYAKFAKIELKAEAEAKAFADGGQISDWAAEAVALCQKAGLVSGKGANRFDPQGLATRAEVASIIKAFAEKYLKQ